MLQSYMKVKFNFSEEKTAKHGKQSDSVSETRAHVHSSSVIPLLLRSFPLNIMLTAAGI